MTPVLFPGLLTPQAGQTLGATVDSGRANMPWDALESLLAGEEAEGPVVDDEPAENGVPLPWRLGDPMPNPSLPKRNGGFNFDLGESETNRSSGKGSRPQGAQMPEANAWPTSALPSFPPLDGQALATSAPSAPDGPRVQVVWGGDAPQFEGNTPEMEASEPVTLRGETLETPERATSERPRMQALRTAEGSVRRPVEATTTVDATSPVEAPSTADVAAPVDATSPVSSSELDARPVVMKMAPAAEPMMQEAPEEPVLRTRVDPQGAVRVELDADLAIEVRQVRQGVEVKLDGTPQALQPMQGIDQEIDAALRDAGSHLERFHQQRRDPNSGKRRPNDDGDALVVADEPSPVLHSSASLIHVVA